MNDFGDLRRIKELVTIFIAVNLVQITENRIVQNTASFEQDEGNIDGLISLLRDLSIASDGAVVLVREDASERDQRLDVLNEYHLTDDRELEDVTQDDSPIVIDAYKLFPAMVSTKPRYGSVLEVDNERGLVRAYAPAVGRSSDVQIKKDPKKIVATKLFNDPLYDARFKDRRTWQKYKRRMKIQKRFNHWLKVRYPKVKDQGTDDSLTSDTDTEDDPEPIVMRQGPPSQKTLKRQEVKQPLSQPLRALLLKKYLEE